MRTLILRESGPRGREFQKEPTSHLPHSSPPWGPNSISPGPFVSLQPLPASSYQFPLLSRQAPEASLSLKTLGEKNHEKLQERAFPTQPLTPASCPVASVSIPDKGRGCWWHPYSPSKMSTGSVPHRGNCQRYKFSYIGASQKHIPQDR